MRVYILLFVRVSMLCAPPDTLARLKWKGKEKGADEVRKGRAEAD